MPIDVTTDSIGDGTRFSTVVDNDFIEVEKNVLVHSNDDYAIIAHGSGQIIDVAGTVSSAGLYATFMGADVATSHNETCQVEELGILRNSWSSGFAAAMVGHDAILKNFGRIQSNGGGVRYEGMGSNHSSFVNYGLVDVNVFAISKLGTEDLQIYNSGSITGEFVYYDRSDGGATSFVNDGLIRGDVGFGDGADVFDGVNGSVTGTTRIYGEGGADRLMMGGGDDVVEGGSGSDTISGGIGQDYLQGQDDVDALGGGDANDTLLGGLGGDYLGGGLGADAAAYSLSATGVVVNLATPSLNTGEAAGDRYNSIERLFGSNHDDTLSGNAGANTLTGGDGADVLSGGAGGDNLLGDAGADTLIGGTGADSMVGGADQDFASYATATAGVIANLFDRTQNAGEAAGDVYGSIEGLIGSKYNDVLTAGADNATLQGGGGNDRLTGHAGFDYLYGGAGADTLYGSYGDDTLIGGAGADLLQGGAAEHDMASYSDATARVIVSLANPSLNKGDAAGDVFSSIENLEGSRFDDYLYGDNSANVIRDGGGHNVIKGYGGDDALLGGPGEDDFVFNTALGPSNVDDLHFSVDEGDKIWLDHAIFGALAPGHLPAAAFYAGAAAHDSDDRIVYDAANHRLSYDPDGTGAHAATVFATFFGGPGALSSADFLVI